MDIIVADLGRRRTPILARNSDCVAAFAGAGKGCFARAINSHRQAAGPCILDVQKS